MNQKDRFTKLTKQKQLRLYLILLPILVITAAVIVNSTIRLLTDKMDLRVDMTQNSLYQLSPQTVEKFQSLNEDIEIFTLYRTGSESMTITNLLEKINSRFPGIHVSNVDPARNPLFTGQFDQQGVGIAENSVIVTDPLRQRYTVISPVEFYAIDSQTGQITGFVAEQRILSAVEYVSTGKQHRVLLSQGHGEADTRAVSQVIQLLEAANYSVVPFNIALSQEPPDPETDLVLIVEPTGDITDYEYGILTGFLGSGGRLMLCMGSGMQAGTFDNLSQLLSKFNFRLGDGILVEEQAANYFNYRTNLVPFMTENDITSALLDANMAVILPQARPILPVSEALRENVATTILLGTSRDSYLSTSMDSIDKEQGDALGPFAIGVAAVEKLGEEHFSYIVVYGSSQWLLDDQTFRNPGNYNLLLTSFEWMYSGIRSTNVIPRPLGDNVLEINNTSVQTFLTIIVLGVIPAGILLIGVFIIIKRARA